jgi:tRNA-2-methylthio-N6-dimethylallyladenosine synthase
MLLTVRLLFQFFPEAGYEHTENIKDAGLILINTCSIRDNAEQRIWGRLKAISHLKKQKKRSENRHNRLYG